MSDSHAGGYVLPGRGLLPCLPLLYRGAACTLVNRTCHRAFNGPAVSTGSSPLEPMSFGPQWEAAPSWLGLPGLLTTWQQLVFLHLGTPELAFHT